ncbi:MAG: UDP-N-acetylmuramoylalanine--D-glutamate ligase [Planctomycetota bacterium]|jgi:UDP-N-acetylmuramoylalanine--D-glutamate ligase
MNKNNNISNNTSNGLLAILGAGESGVGAAILAQKHGFDVFVSDYGMVQERYAKVLDNHNIDWEQGKHSEEKILSAVEVVKSPGIPDKAPIVKNIKAKEIQIISEIEFASRYTDAFIIAITGSNGKTTVTSMIYDLLKNDGKNVGIGGNIGDSFALQVATENHDYYVIEISSFQLDDIVDFKPNISVLMNITPDHLDRYDYKFENYIHSKFLITKNQNTEDLFIYCQDDEATVEYLKNNTITAQKVAFSIKEELEEGAFLTKKNRDSDIQESEINIKLNHNKTFNMPVHKLGLVGQHNIYNSMAAAIVGKATDLKKTTIRESLQCFKNLEHRMEKVLKIGGIQFINDSKATNVNSTWFALESAQAPLVWIAGGVDKGNDYSVLEHLVSKKVHTIICLGKDNRNLHKAFAKHTDLIINTQSMEEAVKVANHFADKGDTIMLSPACASFDLFDNYEDRGRQFKQAVKNL